MLTCFVLRDYSSHDFGLKIQESSCCGVWTRNPRLKPHECSFLPGLLRFCTHVYNVSMSSVEVPCVCSALYGLTLNWGCNTQTQLDAKRVRYCTSPNNKNGDLLTASHVHTLHSLASRVSPSFEHGTPGGCFVTFLNVALPRFPSLGTPWPPTCKTTHLDPVHGGIEDGIVRDQTLKSSQMAPYHT